MSRYKYLPSLPQTLPEMEPSVCFLSPQKRLENGGLLKNIQWCGTYTC